VGINSCGRSKHSDCSLLWMESPSQWNGWDTRVNGMDGKPESTEWMGNPSQRNGWDTRVNRLNFDCHWKSMESWVWTKTLFHPVFSGGCVAQSLDFREVFWGLLFVLFHLAIWVLMEFPMAQTQSSQRNGWDTRVNRLNFDCHWKSMESWGWTKTLFFL
jgi:hypothetical protein